MRITTDHYTTSDLGLATALIAAGFKLVDLDKSNPRRAEFVFARDERINEAVNAHWNSELMVSSFEYFDWLKKLKTRIYS